MDRHQWIALALLVATVFVLLLDATRAVGELQLEPVAVPAKAAEPELEPQLQPAQDLQSVDEQRLVLARQA